MPKFRFWSTSNQNLSQRRLPQRIPHVQGARGKVDGHNGDLGQRHASGQRRTTDPNVQHHSDEDEQVPIQFQERVSEREQKIGTDWGGVCCGGLSQFFFVFKSSNCTLLY